jgi:tetratricopeptide (TPR) repeat protein
MVKRLRSLFNTLIYWVQLLLPFGLFIGLYLLSRPAGEPLELPAWLLVIPAFFAGIHLLGWYQRRRGLPYQQGTELLVRGRTTAALERFEEARARFKQEPVVPYHIGACHLRLWRLEAAEREFSSLESLAQLSSEFKAGLRLDLALVAALQGRGEEARRRLAEARAVDGEDSAGALVILAVVACRGGDCSEALLLLERQETHVLGGLWRGLRDALLAWSLERTTGARRYVELPTLLGEAPVERVQAAWPEFGDFLLERTRRQAA